LLNINLDALEIAELSSPVGIFDNNKDEDDERLNNARMHGWWRGTVVERRSLTGELSLSCARPASDE